MSAPSARGLFRATGKRAKPVSAELLQRLGADEPRADGGLVRERDDFYATPPGPGEALIAAERNRLSLAGRIWEPAVGDGALKRVLEAEGFSVVGSDLVDRGAGATLRDWFDFTRRTRLGDTVVTNPPFGPCNADPGWVRHGWEGLGLDYMALILPFNWLGSGSERAALWRECRPARVYLMRWRIDFTGQGAPPMLCAWMVWDRRAAPGAVTLHMLDRPAVAAGQLTLIGEDA